MEQDHRRGGGVGYNGVELAQFAIDDQDDYSTNCQGLIGKQIL
jgi:hypothetical protein